MYDNCVCNQLLLLLLLWTHLMEYEFNWFKFVFRGCCTRQQMCFAEFLKAFNRGHRLFCEFFFRWILRLLCVVIIPIERDEIHFYDDFRFVYSLLYDLPSTHKNISFDHELWRHLLSWGVDFLVLCLKSRNNNKKALPKNRALECPSMFVGLFPFVPFTSWFW